MQRITPYLQLMRLDKPIGIWLLFFPAAWAVVLAPTTLQWPLLLVMLVGAALIRGAGCILNDLADRRLDAQVARTKNRPLASGALTPRDAWVLLAVLLFDGLLLCLTLPRQSLLLSLMALPLIAAYPWMKRITWWPQAFLGITFNFGALIGWSATGMALSLPSYLLYAACVFWTLGYDTLYAVQDMEDDQTVGIKSTARRIGLGRRLQRFVGLCYAAMFLLLGLCLHLLGAACISWVALSLAAMHAIYQWWRAGRLQPSDPQGGQLFRSNQWLGLLILAGLLLPKLFPYLS